MNTSISRSLKRHKWLLAALLVLALTAAGIGLPAPWAHPAPVAAAPQSSAPVPASGEVAAFQETLEAIYTQVNPSVVSIQVVQKETVSPQDFPDLFPFFGPQGNPQAPQERYSQGAGSGFVWDSAGHIVTNNHVVEGADKISVVFWDGTTVSGAVVGTDPDSDLAVVKVDASRDLLKPVTLADSTQLKAGQLAVAIGNPFGLEGTMTVGFISSLGRLLPVESDSPQSPGYSIPDVIQTDAPINPGNSGGALVDYQGSVIGVTSAIISPVRASASIGFAIPSAVVQKVVPELIANGKYEHPWLGVSGTSLNPDLAKAMSLKPEQRGALVVDVVSGGPGEKAGLKGSDRQIEIDGQEARVGGDVIVAINGQPIKSFDDVVTFLARSGEVNQTITLTLLRDGSEQPVQVTLAARPTASAEAERQTERSTASGAWLGIVGQTVTPDLAQAMNLPEEQKGVLVVQVEVNSPADEAGLRGSYKPSVVNGERVLVGGDIIIAFNGENVAQMEDLQGLVGQAKPGDEASLTVLRDGESTNLSVTLGERQTR